MDPKQILDAIFSQIESKTSNPVLVMAAEFVKHLLESMPISAAAALPTGGIQPIVDGWFAAAEAQVEGHPIELLLLKSLQKYVDGMLASGGITLPTFPAA